MKTLRILIAGREYDVACDDGQEAHLKNLARALDERTQRLSRTIGKTGEAHLLMLAGLTLTDELQDTARELQKCRNDILHSSQSFEQSKQIEIENAIAETIDDIAQRVEAIATELERA